MLSVYERKRNKLRSTCCNLFHTVTVERGLFGYKAGRDSIFSCAQHFNHRVLVKNRSLEAQLTTDHLDQKPTDWWWFYFLVVALRDDIDKNIKIKKLYRP